MLAPLVQGVIDRLGLPWAPRIVGFLCFVFGMLALLLLRQRPTSTKRVQYKLFDPSILEVPGYPCYLVFAFLQFFGFITPIYYIPGVFSPTSLGAARRLTRTRCSILRGVGHLWLE